MRLLARLPHPPPRLRRAPLATRGGLIRRSSGGGFRNLPRHSSRRGWRIPLPLPFSLPCTPSSCATSSLLAHHRLSVISGFSRPSAALPLSGSCARCAAGRAVAHAPCVALATLGRAVSAYGRIFCRLALCVAGRLVHSFPMTPACHSLPMLQASRMLAGRSPFGGGSCRPRPPLMLQSGALPP